MHHIVVHPEIYKHIIKYYVINIITYYVYQKRNTLRPHNFFLVFIYGTHLYIFFFIRTSVSLCSRTCMSTNNYNTLLMCAILLYISLQCNRTLCEYR